MTEQEENNLKEWMNANHNEYLINAAKALKEHCSKIRNCPEKCQFYDDQHGCIIYDYPEWWEV